MKTIKNLMLACMLGLLCHITAVAQPDGPPPGAEKRKEKVEALKRSFYSEKLELTPAEAEKFWPIYNEFAKKEQEMKKASREIGRAHV